jgi:regulator of protease activity HflC (stomatin/prohibitin superfamily)
VFEKFSHTGNLSSYVQTGIMETFKAVTAQYTAPDLIAKRSKVSNDIRSLLAEKLAVYGAQVITIDMKNFSFQDSYMTAINDKVTQEQKKLAADNKLKTVESEQKQKVAVAEAEASAVKAKADGDAYAVLANAKAAADALRLQNAAIRESKDILELKRIEVARIEAERWNGVRVPTTQLVISPTPIAQVK